MKLRFLRQRALDELRNSIAENLPRYRSGDFNYLLSDPALSFETEIEFDESKLSKLRDPEGSELFESNNCTVFLSALKKLTPYEAADERLWALHTSLLSHGRARWPIPKDDEKAVDHIKTHFFASSQRGLERDNVASRLWWMGHLCARTEGLSLNASLDALLYRSDVRANIVERPTTAQSIPVFSAVLRKLAQSYAGNRKVFERKIFRTLMTKLNGLGGYVLLDALETSAVERLIGEIIETDFKIAEKNL